MRTPRELKAVMKRWRQQKAVNTKVHLAVDSHGMQVRIRLTSGTAVDCTEACQQIEGINAEHLLADRANDTTDILQHCSAHHIDVVIPPKRNRKEQREFDRALYKYRHLVENALMKLNAGGVLRHATRNGLIPSWLQFKFAASPYGVTSCDESI